MAENEPPKMPPRLQKWYDDMERRHPGWQNESPVPKRCSCSSHTHWTCEWHCEMNIEIWYDWLAWKHQQEKEEREKRGFPGHTVAWLNRDE